MRLYDVYIKIAFYFFSDIYHNHEIEVQSS
nr:MAG TPA: hypothetical protein [Caudoviricetes sp.]DAX41462.1 MAG TPA: hypothetical protein [Caudoviricetes sp.]